MKNLILILSVFLAAQGLKAQMDEKFYFPDKEWRGINFPAYEEIVFEMERDTVYSVLIKPSAGPKATVLYFHGNGSNLSKWDKHVKPLVDGGFQVCMMDYRGYGKSTGTPTHANILSDAQRLFEIIMARDDLKGLPLIIYGASIGSQVSARLARSNNRLVSGLVLDGAMASFTDAALLTTPEEYRDYVEQYVTSPYSAKEDLPLLRDMRVLFIHSETDAIPIAGARKMFDSLECEKIFWTYDGEHVDAAVRYPEDFMKYMNWLVRGDI